MNFSSGIILDLPLRIVFVIIVDLKPVLLPYAFRTIFNVMNGNYILFDFRDSIMWIRKLL